jgi:hypothetical protein
MPKCSKIFNDLVWGKANANWVNFVYSGENILSRERVES